MASTSVDIDNYISRFPKETGAKLEQIRAIVKKTAPRAEEVISYKMPAFKLNGTLVWYVLLIQSILGFTLWHQP